MYNDYTITVTVHPKAKKFKKIKYNPNPLEQPQYIKSENKIQYLVKQFYSQSINTSCRVSLE